MIECCSLLVLDIAITQMEWCFLIVSMEGCFPSTIMIVREYKCLEEDHYRQKKSETCYRKSQNSKR